MATQRPTAPRKVPAKVPMKKVPVKTAPLKTATRAALMKRKLNKMTVETLPLDQVKPYEFNPRDNAKAVAAVKKSITKFGFMVPAIIDKDNVLITGHTRHQALTELGFDEIHVVRAEHLTPEQTKALRLIDNKSAEIATWSADKLAAELGDLQGLGFDLSGYGWTQEYLDCMQSVVGADCLSATGLMDSETARNSRNQERRAPVQTRITIGEITLFVPASAYKEWVAGLKAFCNFEAPVMEHEILTRLGIPEAG